MSTRTHDGISFKLGTGPATAFLNMLQSRILAHDAGCKARRMERAAARLDAAGFAAEARAWERSARALRVEANRLRTRGR